MDYSITYDDQVARLGTAHPALFEERMPSDSDLAAGWYAIVDQLCTDLERELGPELSRDFVTLQIKEKFGKLRFYWRLGSQGDVHFDIFMPDGTVASSVSKATASRARNGKDIDLARDRVRALVDTACEASASICQRCGAPGTLCRSRTNWLHTLCDQHRRELAERDAKGSAGDDEDGDEA
jgi:hypothetical protein